jgi:hypothetical protein
MLVNCINEISKINNNNNNNNNRPGMVADICNPGKLEGRDQEDHGLRPA